MLIVPLVNQLLGGMWKSSMKPAAAWVTALQTLYYVFLYKHVSADYIFMVFQVNSERSPGQWVLEGLCLIWVFPHKYSISLQSGVVLDLQARRIYCLPLRWGLTQTGQDLNSLHKIDFTSSAHCSHCLPFSMLVCWQYSTLHLAAGLWNHQSGNYMINRR